MDSLSKHGLYGSKYSGPLYCLTFGRTKWRLEGLKSVQHLSQAVVVHELNIIHAPSMLAQCKCDWGMQMNKQAF